MGWNEMASVTYYPFVAVPENEAGMVTESVRVEKVPVPNDSFSCKMKMFSVWPFFYCSSLSMALWFQSEWRTYVAAVFPPTPM